MDKKLYCGLTVRSDGIILRNGRIVRERSNGRVYFHINGKPVSKLRSRIVFEAMTGRKLRNNETVAFRDGNPENCAWTNLYSITTAERRASLDIDTRRRKFTREEAEAVRSEYYSTGTPIRELAKKYGCSVVTVNKMTRGEYYAD